MNTPIFTPSTPTSASASTPSTKAPSRRQALHRLVALVGAVGVVNTGCGGGVAAVGSDSAQAPPAAADPPNQPDANRPPPVPNRQPPSVQRLQNAIRNVQPLTVAPVPVRVTQGGANVGAPLLGPSALILPTPLGATVRPNPVTLADLPQWWGWRRDTWARLPAGYFGNSDANQSWFQPMQVSHPAATSGSVGACATHFVFDGRAFEILFAGVGVEVVLIADGQYQSARYINTSLQNGVPGAPLNRPNTYTQFDFGNAAVRRISLYCRSTQGPCAIATAPGDTLQAWDRSDEPAMCAMADSYGGFPNPHWGGSGPFWEAAALLGIPHVDLNYIGGTGYAPNNTNADTRNPGNAFAARINSSARAEPDLFVTAGGINDNNWLAAPPLFATGEDARASFIAGVNNYYQNLRAALPGAVLVAIGPWQPNVAFYPSVAPTKVATIKAALQATSGPWVFIDNLQGGWINSAGRSAPATGQPWQTGSGNVGNPRGDGNGDIYVLPDGVHPTEAGCSYLAEQLFSNLRAAILAF
jgi:lysophospholipase L1-like esterase